MLEEVVWGIVGGKYQIQEARSAGSCISSQSRDYTLPRFLDLLGSDNQSGKMPRPSI